MRKIVPFYILIFSALLQSCSLWEKDGDIVKINYGTSFGECIGFCKNDLTITTDSVYYKSQSWYPLIQIKTHRISINKEHWDYFREELNEEYFLDLPHVIGCPDCADGGAEWLEIQKSNREKHKVIFEYRNEPAGLSNYIDSLRLLMSMRD